jgi:hypothetical protein
MWYKMRWMEEQIKRLNTVEVPINDGAGVYRNATQTFNLSANVTYNTELWDNNDFWNAANGDRFVAPANGMYMVGFSISGGSDVAFLCNIQKYNAASVLQQIICRHLHPAYASGGSMSFCAPVEMIATDYCVISLSAFAAAFVSSAANATTSLRNCFGWIARIK